MVKKTGLLAAAIVLIGLNLFASVKAATTIGLISDGQGASEMTTDINQLLLQKLSGWTINSVSWNGDIAYSGTIASALQSYASSTASAIPLFLVAGNHEAESTADMVALRAQYAQYPAWNLSQMPNSFSSTTNYAYDVGDVRVIAVNQYAATTSDAVNTTGRIHEQVFEWIRNEIKSTTKEHIVVMGHEPAYPVPSQTSGNHIGDALDADTVNRDRFVNLLASYGNIHHMVGHTHIADLYEMRDNSPAEGDARTTTTTLDGGIWELDSGSFGTMSARTAAPTTWPAVGYYHASSSNWGDYQLRLVQGYGPTTAWSNPVVKTKTISDLTRQILVNTWEGSGTGTTTSGVFDMKYYVDYTPAAVANPNWSSNNSGKWWEPAFNADSAGWTGGEMGVGYKTGGTAPGWINTPISPYGGLSTTTNQVYSVMQRVTFPATSTQSYGNMTLHYDDDDGFMVWLNGSLIFNNTATVTAPTSGAGSEYFDKYMTNTTNNWAGAVSTPTFTTVDVSAYKNLLVNGDNKLAIWNVNGGTTEAAATASSDIGVAVRLSLSGAVDVTAPVISSVASTSPTPNTATITWTTDENSDSRVQYGLTTSYGSFTTLDSTQTTSHSVGLTGLATSTLYHYRVISKDVSGNTSTSTDYTVTTPAVATTTPTTVTFKEGVNSYTGMIDTYIGDTTTTTNFGTGTEVLIDGDAPFANGLLKWDVSSIPSNSVVTSAKIVYYATNISDTNTPVDSYKIYRSLRPWTEAGATWNTYDGSASWGTVGSLNTTSDYNNTQLGTIGTAAINTFSTSTLNSSGVGVVQGWVDGSITNNGFFMSDDPSTDGLRFTSSEGTTAANRPALVITYTPPAGPDTTAPVISAIATSTGATTATITWTTDEAATSTLSYGTTSSYGSSTSTASTATSHSYTLTGLSNATTYHYQIRVADSSGNVATSSDLTFTTTAPDTTAPVISSIGSSTTSTTATITWTTNEASDTQVNYGTTSTYSASTTLNSTATTTHSATITGLNSNTTYHFRVRSTDASGNLATSSDATFKTTVSTGVAFEVYVDTGDVGVSTNRSTTTNVMNYGPSDGASTSTIKFADGTATGITLAYSGTNVNESTGAEDGTVAEDGTTGSRSTPVYPQVGTDAYNEFGTKVNLGGLTSIGTANTNFSATLTGLDTNKLYTIVALGTRGRYSDRYCKFELIGASTFSNQKSSAAVATTTTMTDDSTVYLCGANYANGYVAKWTDIDPSSTTLTIKTTGINYLGTSTNRPYLSALKIVEQEPASDTTGPIISSIAADPDTTSASVTWTTNEAATSLVEYGTTASYGSSSSLNSSLTTSHTRSISGLSPSTLYHYRVISEDANGNSTTSSDGTFTTDVAADVLAPVISSISSSTSATTATISWTTDEAATSTINYGLTTSYGTATTSASLVTSHGRVLTGLTPSTTYHYQISVADAANNVATSSDLTFTTTAAPDTTAPVISSVGSSTGPTTATITWTTNEAATSTVEYGTTTSYGSTSTSASLVTSHSIELTGLALNTLYHFRVSSTDSSSNRATSTDYTFVTQPDTTGPTFSALLVSPSDDSATVTWGTNEQASSQVTYGITLGLGTTTTEADTSPRVTSHTVVLSGLSTCTTYAYQVAGRDASLNLSSSTESSFTTTGCTGGAGVEDVATEEVDSSAGGTSSLTSGTATIELDIPAGFAATDAVFQIKKIDGGEVISSVGTVSGKTAAENLIFDLKAYEDDETLITNFLSAITITLSYDDDDIEDLEESSLLIYRYNGSSWSALDNCVVDTSANTISCETTHFSTFGIFGEEEARSSGGGGGGSSGSSKKKKTVAAVTPVTPVTTPTTPVATPVTSGYLFIRDLQIGAIGADVKELQKFLNKNGFAVSLTGVGSTGYETETFGPATKAALMKFQDANARFVLTPAGLTIGTGYFGTFTRNHINSLTGAKVPVSTEDIAPVAPVTVIAPPAPLSQTFTRQLDVGDTGADVKALQSFLNDRGFSVAQTGPGSKGSETSMYGFATQAAVKRFQEAYASEILTPNGFTKGTGQLGPATLKKITQLLSSGQ